MSTVAERARMVKCECGTCDVWFAEGGGRKYANEKHKQRHYRARLKKAAAQKGVPAAVSFATLDRPKDTGGRNGDAQRRRSGAQVSYRKAVRVLAQQLYLWDASKTPAQAEELADIIMREALPARQRKDRP